MKSFTANLLEQRGHRRERVYYLHASDRIGRAYYFILIDPVKEKQFLHQLKQKGTMLDLEEFAIEILAKGYGEPPEDTKQHMRQRYGVCFDEDEGSSTAS